MKKSFVLRIFIFAIVQILAIALYFLADSYLDIQMPEHKSLALIALISLWIMFFIYEYANRPINKDPIDPID